MMDESSSIAKIGQRQEAECILKPKKLAICEPQIPQCDLQDNKSNETGTESPCASSLGRHGDRFINNTGERTDDELLSIDAVPSVSESSSEKPSDSLQGYDIVEKVQKVAAQGKDENLSKINQYMPWELTYGYKDAVILCNENDLPEVKRFKSKLETKIVLLGRERPKIALLHEIELLKGNLFEALEFALERCTFVFPFITSSFVNNEWSTYSIQVWLMESITNPKKRWTVVPVFTEKRETSGYKIPIIINTLKGVTYLSRDDCDVESIRELFEGRISVRKEKEREATGMLRAWLFKYDEEMQLNARSRNEELKQQKASLDYSLSMPSIVPTSDSEGAPHYQH